MINKVIGYQGVEGAHSDLACKSAYPDMDRKSYPSFESLMNAVEVGEIDLCMIPIENSYAGRVAEIHNLLQSTKLHIIGEYFQVIKHHLAGPKGAKIDNIKTVLSHPQALMQCKNKISKYGFETQSASNTAYAAKKVGEEGDLSKAALCSELAVKIYDLDVIQENMQDVEDNITIFVAMAREPIDPDVNKKIVTSLLFTARNIPSALFKALGGFATNQVNILKIESYIPGGVSKTAQFFLTFEGNPTEESNVRLAVEELGFFCKKVKVLGVYNADGNRE